MILINIYPIGIIVLLVLAAPYLYGWLRIEIYSFIQECFDEDVAKAWAMPKYKHYLRYLRIKFIWLMIHETPKPEEMGYAKVVAKDLFSINIPKYVLEANLLSGKSNKIKALWQWTTWKIKKWARLKWRV